MEHALENGKEVFAVPGPIHSPLSEGPHLLITEGAKPVWNGRTNLEELNILNKLTLENEKPCILVENCYTFCNRYLF